MTILGERPPKEVKGKTTSVKRGERPPHAQHIRNIARGKAT